MKLSFSKRYQITGISLLLILFVVSVLIRKKDIGSELGRDHEWITAHSLVTMEIWDKNGGPSSFYFSPVYSYPNTYSFGRRSMGGVTDTNGLHYYISYPPFAFIFGYYGTQVLGGPTLLNIRILNLFIHFICALFVYLIFAEILSRSRSYHFNIAGLVAASLYLFLEGFLWIHGMLYFVDTVEQMWVLICLFIIIRFFRKQKHPKLFLALLFTAFFVAVYTEWQAVFLSFFSGLAFLTIYFFRKEKKFLHAFIIIGTASIFAIGLMLMQYSHISGWEDLLQYWQFKFSERSGYVTNNPKFNLHIDNDKTHLLLKQGINKYFKIAQNVIGAVSLAFLLVLIVPISRKSIRLPKRALLIFSLLFLSVLTHYIVFFNFNALHSFSSVKMGMLLVLGAGIIVHLIIASLPGKKIKIFFSIALILYTSFKLVQSVQHYQKHTNLSHLDTEAIGSAKFIRQEAIADMPLFANIPFHLQNLYYSKRDLYYLPDTSKIYRFMEQAKFTEVQYFLYEKTRLKELLHYHLENDQLYIKEQKKYSPE